MPAAPDVAPAAGAALSGDGFHYFSDEFALLEHQTLRVRPVPLSLTIKRGAVDLLTSYHPGLGELPAHTREDGQIVRYLNPTGRPFDSESSEPVGWLIFPRYKAGEVTALRPVSKPEALRRLLQECLALPELLDRAAHHREVGQLEVVEIAVHAPRDGAPAVSFRFYGAAEAGLALAPPSPV